jgi:probable rRNA maturation factor
VANKISISWGSDKKAAGHDLRKFAQLLALTLKQIKKTSEYKKFVAIMGTPKNLELRFCDDKEMRSLQKKFRKLDRTTDVLSFPSVESPDNHEEHFMGSIVISLSSVKRNAKTHKRSVQAELGEVFIHGILHLFGFDHVAVTPRKRKEMRALQQLICDTANF